MLPHKQLARISSVVLVAWVLLFVGFVCWNRIDPDYGWHFRSGQYILQHGIPHYDVFTYTARSFVWVNHEWLSDVFIYFVASSWGYGALACIFAVVWTAALVLGMRCRLNWAIAGLALGGVLLYIGARSDVWTALGLALTLVILDSRRQNFWWLVPLMAIWANLHAGFIAGLLMVLLKVITSRSKRLALWGLAAALATLVNPYTYGVYVELFRTLGDSKLSSSITEWAPLTLNHDVAPYLIAVAVCLVLWSGWGFLRILGVMLCAAAVWSNRNMSLLVVGTSGMLAASAARAGVVIKEGTEQRLRWVNSPWTRGAVALAVGVLFPLSLLLYPPSLPSSLTLATPSTALASLLTDSCHGQLFNDYNYGGLIIWRLPGVPVYIDGRMPSWSGPRGRYLDLYNRVLAGGAFAQQEFTRYNVQCALITKYDSSLSKWLATQPGWHMTVNDQDAQLWREIK